MQLNGNVGKLTRANQHKTQWAAEADGNVMIRISVGQTPEEESGGSPKLVQFILRGTWTNNWNASNDYQITSLENYKYELGGGTGGKVGGSPQSSGFIVL